MALQPPGSPSQKQPFWLSPAQPWSSQQVSTDHDEVLYTYGEYAMFVMLWHVVDFEAGRVGRCSTCYVAYGRFADAYAQPAKSKCPDCYGTTFEGGYRAKIIRPAILTDRNTETQQGSRGEFVVDTLDVETTTDFYCRNGDFVFRSDGTRWRLNEMDSATLREGFTADDAGFLNLSGVTGTAHLEDDSSVAYQIPPDNADLKTLLTGLSSQRHLAANVAQFDDVRGPLLG